MHQTARSSFHFGPFELDLTERRLLRDGQPVPLTPKAFDLLSALVANGGRLVLKEDLFKQVWPDTFVDAATLSRVVSVLRASLQEVDGARFIETVPKRGYRFVAPVTERPDDEATVPPSLPTAVRPRFRLAVGALASSLLVLTTFSVLLLLSSSEPASPPTVPGAPLHRQLTSTGRDAAPSIAPDGRRIAYVSMADPDRLLLVTDRVSGQSVVAFRAPEIDSVRWSPDGERLLFFARGPKLPGGLFVVSRTGGEPRRIVTGLYKGCWSPDGLRVAAAVFIRGAIAIVDREGGRQMLPLNGDHRWVWDIDWSPAADRLLVVTDDGLGRHSIWTIRPDGTDQRLVHDDGAELRGARWAGDGDTIYFSRREDQTTSFFRVAADGTSRGAPVALPLLSGLETGGAFTLTADSRQLAYARAPFHSDLWSVDLGDARRSRPMTTTRLTNGTTLVERPRISRDGTWLVFNRGYDGRADLFVMPVAGGPPRQLTSLNALSLGGIWSPDGRQIAFVSNDGGHPRVWLLDAGGGSARALSDSIVSDSYVVAWSSGSRLLYQRTDNRDFGVIDPATGRDEGRLLGEGAVGWIFSPELAPDGRRLAAAWNRPDDRGMWIFDLATGARRLVLNDLVLPIGWAADGRSVYAVKAEPGVHRGLSVMLGETTRDTRILQVPVDGRPARELLRLPFDEVGGVSVSADGRTVVAAVYSSQSDVWIVEGFDTAGMRLARTRTPNR